MNLARDISLKETINGIAGLSFSGITAWVHAGLIPSEFVPHQLAWLRAAAVIVIFCTIVVAFMLRGAVRRRRHVLATMLGLALCCVIGIRSGYIKSSGNANYLIGFGTPHVEALGKCIDFGDRRFACAGDEAIAAAYGGSYWILLYSYLAAYLILASALVALIVSIQIEERIEQESQ